MESPGKKFTDLVEIESIQDTDLTVVRNDTGVKKTTMQKLSDYIKQKFIGWVFSDLPTTDKTIPGALKELNSALAKIALTNIASVNFGYDNQNAFNIDFNLPKGHIAKIVFENTGIRYLYFDGSDWNTIWTK